MGDKNGFHILDEIDEYIFIVNLEDRTIVFLNEKLRNSLHVKDYFGKKVEDIIPIQTGMCEICNENILSEKFNMGKSFIFQTKQYYLLKQKIMEYNGKKCCFGIGIDITEGELKNIENERRKLVETTIFNFMNYLKISESRDDAIEQILEKICKYYQADRGYIFNIDYDKQITYNTYEYAEKGITPQIQNLQDIPLSVIDRWIQAFQNNGTLFIQSLEEEISEDSEEYRILKQQGIQSLLAYPFSADGKIIGFIGIDNPRYDIYDTTILRSISLFVLYDIAKTKTIERLQILSTRDSLTGLKNRNSYIQEITALEEHLPNSLGVIFLDLNGLKRINDVHGHTMGDRSLNQVGQILLSLFRGYSYRVGGDEFVVLMTDVSENEYNNRVEKLKECIASNKEIDLAIGTAFKEHPLQIEALITEADSRMYERKKEYYDSLND